MRIKAVIVVQVFNWVHPNIATYSSAAGLSVSFLAHVHFIGDVGGVRCSISANTNRWPHYWSIWYSWYGWAMLWVDQLWPLCGRYEMHVHQLGFGEVLWRLCFPSLDDLLRLIRYVTTWSQEQRLKDVSHIESAYWMIWTKLVIQCSRYAQS